MPSLKLQSPVCGAAEEVGSTLPQAEGHPDNWAGQAGRGAKTLPRPTANSVTTGSPALLLGWGNEGPRERARPVS